MTFIGKNIKKIRAVKKLSQASFAKLFDLARPSVGAYEEGRAEPKLETVIQIAQHFGLSIDILLTKEITINELYKFDIFRTDFKEKFTAKSNELAHNISEGNFVRFVSTEKMFEYIANHKNKDFIEKLPPVYQPGSQLKITRAFQHSGQEMENGGRGIHNSDILFCEQITNVTFLRKGRVYIVITETGYICRRFAKDGALLSFTPDNPNYDIVQLYENNVLEIWEVKGVYSQNLKVPTMVEERVLLLEKQMEEILKKLE